jgi:hypothetical protein
MVELRVPGPYESNCLAAWNVSPDSLVFICRYLPVLCSCTSPVVGELAAA